MGGGLEPGLQRVAILLRICILPHPPLIRMSEHDLVVGNCQGRSILPQRCGEAEWAEIELKLVAELSG